MVINTSDLYEILIETHKDNPRAIIEEYNEKFKDQERFIRYGSITLGFLSISIFLIGLNILSLVWNTIEFMVLSIPLMLLICLITTLVTYRLLRIADSSSKFSEFPLIKKTYENAYIDTLYPNQIDRENRTEGLRSKWILKRYYSKWKLFNNPEK